MRHKPKPRSVNLTHRRPGRCRYCSCTEDRACDAGCWWYDEEQTVCSSETCVARFRAALAETVRRLLRVGLDAQKLNALSCYGESLCIVETLLAELRIDVTEAAADAS
jgi:hypothetical protein